MIFFKHWVVRDPEWCTLPNNQLQLSRPPDAFELCDALRRLLSDLTTPDLFFLDMGFYTKSIEKDIERSRQKAIHFCGEKINCFLLLLCHWALPDFFGTF